MSPKLLLALCPLVLFYIAALAVPASGETLAEFMVAFGIFGSALSYLTYCLKHPESVGIHALLVGFLIMELLGHVWPWMAAPSLIQVAIKIAAIVHQATITLHW